MEKSISCCIITHDEPKIFKTIESVKSSCSEIIIGYNGNDPIFKQQLCNTGAIVYDYLWQEDFAAARNFILEKAKYKWILIIDSDEVLEKPITNLSNKFDFYFATQKTEKIQVKHIRVFKNSAEIRYKNKIHESVDESVRNLRGAISDIVILHDSCFDENKLKRNYSILKTDIYSPVYNFYSALYFFNTEDFYKTISFAQAALQDELTDELRAIMCNVLSESYCMIANRDAALSYIALSICLVPIQVYAHAKILEFLTKKDYKIALQQINRLLKSQTTQLSYDIIVSQHFLKTKKEEIEKWQLA